MRIDPDIRKDTITATVRFIVTVAIAEPVLTKSVTDIKHNVTVKL